MDWLLDNIQFVIAIVLLIAYGLRGLRRQGREEDDGALDPGQQRGPRFDPDEAERTRRIQEEIRRRILARQRGEDPRPVVVFEEPAPAPPPLRETPLRPPPMPPPVRHSQAYAAPDPSILERQRMLEERLEALRQSRSHFAVPVPRPTPSLGAAMRKAGSGTGRRIRDQLRRPEDLRRAILLREILAPPQGLRSGPPELPRV